MEEWAIISLLDPYYICTVCTCYPYLSIYSYCIIVINSLS
jgi:hypothetical protein